MYYPTGMAHKLFSGTYEKHTEINFNVILLVLPIVIGWNKWNQSPVRIF